MSFAFASPTAPAIGLYEYSRDVIVYFGFVPDTAAEVGRTTVAIPVEVYQLNRTELLEFGRVVSRPERAWIGAYFQPGEQGVMVVGVVSRGPAEAAGIREGDVVLAVNFCTVETRRDLYEELWKKRAGEKVVFKILRKDPFF